jgi:hypothetical protein
MPKTIRKPVTHVLKLNEEYRIHVLTRMKQFEIRYDDRDYREFDRIKFDAPGFEGKEYLITYVLRGFSGPRQGYVAMSIEDLKIEEGGTTDEES